MRAAKIRSEVGRDRNGKNSGSFTCFTLGVHWSGSRIAEGPDGVHLGQDDVSPILAREHLGAKAIVGVTCHASLDLAQQAIKQGANYVAFGRFFPSNTKPDAPPAPLSLLTAARDVCEPTPVVAIGGITLENGAQVLAAGADTLAVSHSLFAAADIKRQAQAFIALQKNIETR